MRHAPKGRRLSIHVFLRAAARGHPPLILFATTFSPFRHRNRTKECVMAVRSRRDTECMKGFRPRKNQRSERHAMRNAPTSVFTACDDAGFCIWLETAKTGQTLEYHRGFLAEDANPQLSQLPEAHRIDLTRLAGRAYRAAEQRLVHLVQRRLMSGSFSYLAIRRPGIRLQVKLTPVSLECAA